MKVLFTVVVFLIFFSSCKENGVQPAKSSTFVRYLSDGNPDEAVDVLQTSDNAFLILSYTKPSNSAGWINLTKIDIYGNEVAGGKVPIKPVAISGTSPDLRPSNIVAIRSGGSADKGYLIVGTLQHPSIGSQLYVAVVNTDLTVARSAAIFNEGGSPTDYTTSSGGTYLVGKGVAHYDSARDDFFVIANVLEHDLTTAAFDGSGVQDMYFARINGATLDTVYTRIYGGGTADLVNRIYLDASSQTKAYWGGARTDNYGIHLRLVEANSGVPSGIPSASANDFVYPLGDFSKSYTGGDFCPVGFDFFAIAGSQNAVNLVPGSYDSISFCQAWASNGQLVAPIKNFPLKFKQTALPGNSICTTLDGGFLLLGTMAQDGQGTNTDYYLLKLDKNGAKQWDVTHGGKYPDVGVRVLQSSDGGYVVLGTTTLANVKTVFLMKTDAHGNIQ